MYPNFLSSTDILNASPSSDPAKNGTNTYILLTNLTYFWSYYENPILSPYVTSWIGFQPPQIETVLYLCTIDLSFMPGYFH